MERRSTQLVLVSLAALVAVVCAAAWGFLIHKSSQYRADMAVVAQEIADASIKNSRHASIRASLKDVRGSIDEISANFIQESQIPDFISGLEKSAGDYGIELDISSINLGGTPEDLVPRSLSLRLNGRGTWRDSVAFIASLDAMPYALDVDDVSLNAGEGEWRFVVDVVQYVIK